MIIKVKLVIYFYRKQYNENVSGNKTAAVEMISH